MGVNDVLCLDMDSGEVIEDYKDNDMGDMVIIVEKQDDLMEIQTLIIKLLLLSGFLAFLLLMFLLYHLNIHFKLLRSTKLHNGSRNSDGGKIEKPMKAATEEKRSKCSIFTLTKPLSMVENDRAEMIFTVKR